MPLTSPPKQKQKSPKIQADACLVESLKREPRWDFHLNVRSPRWEPIVLVNSAEQLFTQLNLGRNDLIDGWRDGKCVLWSHAEKLWKLSTLFWIRYRRIASRNLNWNSLRRRRSSRGRSGDVHIFHQAVGNFRKNNEELHYPMMCQEFSTFPRSNCN